MSSIIESIKNAGVVGAGGAGFPTHEKLNATVEYLIINAAECEPLLKTDHYVMRNHAIEIVKAILTMKEHTKAKYAVIATKRYYTQEIESLNLAIKELQADVTLKLMDNYYPAGDEQLMVYEVTGRIVPPAAIPLSVGCIVSNVTTMLNIYRAVFENQPVITKQLTITGAVNQPTLVETPIGTPFEKLLEVAGGSDLENFLFIDGGPMMGKLFTDKELSQKVVTKTSSGIILKEDEGYLSKLKHQTLDQIFLEASSACIQCSLCTELCPRQNLGHEVFPHKVMRYFGGAAKSYEIEENEILKGAKICSECGICEVIACPMGLSPRQVNKFVKSVLGKNGVRYQTEKKCFAPHPMREYRQINPKNILIKMGLKKYENISLKQMKHIEVNEVFIPLKMHIGAPSVPIVKIGDFVHVGDLIASIPENSLGANIHASISGKVMNVTNNEIHIKRTEK
ncbi:Na+-translocating ferredoxin:NAD+ oxidoreductase RNF, RnfC subunit [Pilibacter termitis]|uniref:Na+-translocating ferredoxin:NAD+ oxidoreductase RNF, RnfC subunit n=1 Tax=Pilibacter termitis TaxID=263852 RepID=A0A1T4L919_9ENTE|nr:4Fe-4S dicluster domain-containing protein [Pilibacter termitis]SJZ51262.1 Na+-translocating ferredoxin:NAD+ oxidoreductase RNF, RnfC subunit [Pilibacter termitis]